MINSSKRDVSHVPTCMFDNTAILFLSCAGPLTPHESAWPTKSRLKLCRH